MVCECHAQIIKVPEDGTKCEKPCHAENHVVAELVATIRMATSRARPWQGMRSPLATVTWAPRQSWN